MIRNNAHLLEIFVFFAGSLSAASITIGLPATPANGNCIPFGCPGGPIGVISEYQQIFAASSFSSPISIMQISFFNTQLSPGTITSATYNFSLSTSSRTVSGLSSTLASNIGADSRAFFSGVLSGPIPGGILTITGSPFLYNPANGNLLLDIAISGQATNQTVSSVFLDQSDGTAGTTNRAVTTTLGSLGGAGLITRFTDTSVPEPGTFAFLCAGLVFLKAVSLRRQ